MQRTTPLLSGAALSLLVHAVATVVLLTLPAVGALEKNARDEKDRLVELSPFDAAHGASSRVRGHAPHEAERAEAGGATHHQNIDALDPGQGGDVTGTLVGIRLLTQRDPVLLFDSPLNNTVTGQLQRIRTARDRATLERRRATPNPHDQAWLASGDGAHPERRPLAARDAAEGARVAPVASLQGGLPSVAREGREGRRAAGEERGASGAPSAASSDARGASEASPGRGILRGEGERASERARVAFGRPAVDQGPAATRAEESDARVRDRVDAEELAGSMVQSRVNASGRTSRSEGPGRGGVQGAGAPGSGGGRREGGRAAPYGPGDGDRAALDTSDARYVRWLRESRRRVLDALRYPRARALAMDQGTAVYRITIDRSGQLLGAPRLVRTSNFSDLDAEALRAIRSVTPFSPLPDALAPGLTRIPILFPVEFSNPMVR